MMYRFMKLLLWTILIVLANASNETEVKSESREEKAQNVVDPVIQKVKVFLVFWFLAMFGLCIYRAVLGCTLQDRTPNSKPHSFVDGILVLITGAEWFLYAILCCKWPSFIAETNEVFAIFAGIIGIIWIVMGALLTAKHLFTAGDNMTNWNTQSVVNIMLTFSIPFNAVPLAIILSGLKK